MCSTTPSVIAKVNPSHRFFLTLMLRAHEAKTVMALDLAKRRNMEYLAGPLLDTKAGCIQQVAMPFAESVVHFHHDGAQGTSLVVHRPVAVPEAHWLEGMTQHPRIAVQPDFTGRIGDAFTLQQFVQPGHHAACFGASAIAMVAFKKAHGSRTVDGPDALRRLARLAQAAHRQH